VVTVQSKSFRAGDLRLTFMNFDVSGPAVGSELDLRLSEIDGTVGLDRVARQAFFVADEETRTAVSGVLAARFGHSLPATTYVYQPPADGHPLAVEVWAVGDGAAVEQRGGLRTVTTERLKLGFLGGGETRDGEGVSEGVPRVLEQARGRLVGAGFSLSGLLRTWYYIGEILEQHGEVRRYDEFNRTRNEFYKATWPDLRYSPASTGIGMMTRRVALEWVALADGAEGVGATWIDNPLQTKPYQYDVGVEGDRKPSFSRASALTVPGAAILFVSGTASIRDSEVLCAGDPGAQTAITLENIATLIGDDNLVGNYGFARGASLEDVVQFRVYVKRARDLDVIRDGCRRCLGDVPRCYVVADVCRPECLVEVEAVAAIELPE